MFAALILFASAQAASAPSQPMVSTATVAAAPEKKVCRSIVTTGSIMPKKSCMTQREWKKMQDETDAAWETARAKRGFTARSQTIEE